MNKQDIEAALNGLFYTDGTFRFRDIHSHTKTIQYALRLAHKVMSEEMIEKGYYVYFDSDKPYKSPCLGKIYLHTNKPTEHNIICARRTTGKNLVLKKVRLKVENNDN